MKPFKIYLDTSVVLMYDDHSQRGIITKEFFKEVSKNNHQLVISEIVNTEITDNKAKRESNLSFLSTINYKLLPYSDESYYLAWTYVFGGVLTHNHLDDLLHIAYATIFECDVIVSWNRKHIAKPIKIQKINVCNLKNNYKMIAIYTPEEFLIYFK
ncbi:MAG: hypothetical protein LBG58_01710 [Planctomycetaceae bacterium]|jgi:hypothetical protein|nr:hypothetical protein [Planctomycetaceae bacterium]